LGPARLEWLAAARTAMEIEADASLAEALELMERQRSQIWVLPVRMNADRALGIIRIHDIYLGSR
jgi:CBS domain-containing protein